MFGLFEGEFWEVAISCCQLFNFDSNIWIELIVSFIHVLFCLCGFLRNFFLFYSRAVEEAKSPADIAVQVTVEKKPAPGTKTTRRVVKRVIKKTVVRPVSRQKNKSGEGEKTKIEESMKENDAVEAADQDTLVKDAETVKNGEISNANVRKSATNEELKVGNIEGVEEEKLDPLKVEEPLKNEEMKGKNEESLLKSVKKSPKERESAGVDAKPLKDQEPTRQKDKEDLTEQQEEEQMKTTEGNMETASDECKIEEDPEEERTDFDGLLEDADDDKIEDVGDQEIHDELNQREFAEDHMQEQGEEVLEEERAELNAAAKERKLRKELEIFVGGLDRDVMEEDLKKVFQYAGEVVDVRLHKDPSTNKNKGYAFVRFATKEQANRALSEMRNPVVRFFFIPSIFRYFLLLNMFADMMHLHIPTHCIQSQFFVCIIDTREAMWDCSK